MADWFGYALSDFLLFAPETYWRLFEQMNTALWPAQVPLLAGVAGLVVAAMRGWRRAGLCVGVGLAGIWALVAHVFLAGYYLPINWAVASLLPLAWGQAMLVLVLAPGLRFETGHGRWPALGLAGLALAYPGVGLLFERPLAQAEIAGLAPDPTAILTLGILGLARPGWPRAVLSILPACWCVLSAATLLTMGDPSGWVVIAALLVALVSWIRVRVPERMPDTDRWGD